MAICLFSGYGEVFNADEAAEVGAEPAKRFGFVLGKDVVEGTRWAKLEG